MEFIPLDIVSDPVPVACRCSARMHYLAPAKLRLASESGPAKRGRPRRIPVHDLE